MFEPGFLPSPPVGEPSLVVRVRGDTVAVEHVPFPEAGHFLGMLDGLPCAAVADDDPAVADDDPAVADDDPAVADDDPAVADDDPASAATFVGLRALWGQVTEPVWAVAGRAVQIVTWDRTHRFCGQCGGATQPLADHRARRCPQCELDVHPRLAPAVIVLVERSDGRVLLARNTRFPTAFYSCLAGFVEPGETLEEAVQREVREEVGIEVTGARYFGSQPWPFPHSLMIGFVAEFASGELRPDGDEIAEAAWFSPSDLPLLPSEMSIARALIESWRRRS
jgi:NAD+ diphosphatase